MESTVRIFKCKRNNILKLLGFLAKTKVDFFKISKYFFDTYFGLINAGFVPMVVPHEKEVVVSN